MEGATEQVGESCSLYTEVYLKSLTCLNIVYASSKHKDNIQ